MRYRLLGNSGMRVSELSLGTMTFGEEWGWGASKEESRKIFDRFVEAGGNFIDTANRYTEGTSERFVGEFIAADRDRFVVATKYTLFDTKGDPNASGNHRKNLMRSLEGSLRRLGIDCVDLLWLHMWDFTTPVDEVMRALDDVVRQGKAIAIGISDTPAWIVAQANTLAALRGWAPFVALQIQYNLVDRTAERDLLPMAAAFGLAVTPWAPLAAGILTGKYFREEPEGRIAGSALREKFDPRSRSIAKEVVAVADEMGRTPSQIALNWLRAKGSRVIPIIGARTEAQLQDNLGCLEFSLDRELVARLDAASAIDLGFPHDFLARPGIRELVYGGMDDEIDRGH